LTQESGTDAVRSFLRGQNLEQVGRVDEATELYEAAIAANFDSSGPYDRLIFIYSDRALHLEVVRVAEAALASVRTYEEKRAWYERMRSEAIKAQSQVPRAVPKNRGT
jgi:hypothetical protein